MLSGESPASRNPIVETNLSPGAQQSRVLAGNLHWPKLPVLAILIFVKRLLCLLCKPWKSRNTLVRIVSKADAYCVASRLDSFGPSADPTRSSKAARVFGVATGPWRQLGSECAARRGGFVSTSIAHSCGLNVPGGRRITVLRNVLPQA